MKKDRKEKLADVGSGDLEKRVNEEQGRLVELLVKRKAGKSKDVHSPSKKRHEIARILTELRERQLGKPEPAGAIKR